MLILQLFRWLILIAEVWIAGPILYLCVIAVTAILTTKKRKTEGIQHFDQLPTANSSRTSFGILIPAYNEEAVLDKLLESLFALDYPRKSFTVHVVADNCTDGTADLARAKSWVHVYERFDTMKHGKGYAINWLLHELGAAHLIYDAYVIFDADSVVETNFLLLMERELLQGSEALQACHTVLNVSASPITALRWIATALINHVRPLGRNGLGFSSTLTGNGMCLSHALLMRYPWRAFTETEDYEYYLTLIQHGVRVRYVPEAIVRSLMPTVFVQMRSQDRRWESLDHGQPTWRIVLSLWNAGVQARDFGRIEAIVELLTPPLSVIVSWCLLTMIMALLVWSPLELWFSLIFIAGLVCYIGTAFYLLRPPRIVYRALLYAPGFMIWKLWLYLVLIRTKTHNGYIQARLHR